MCTKAEWIKEVEKLCSSIETEMKANTSIRVHRGKEIKTEYNGETYMIPSLLMEFGSKNVVVTPVSRFVNSYDGRVDVFRNNRRVFALVLKDNKWRKLNAIKKFPNLLSVRETRFSPKSFTKAFSGR